MGGIADCVERCVSYVGSKMARIEGQMLYDLAAAARKYATQEHADV
jgi:hypothetical protein